METRLPIGFPACPLMFHAVQVSREKRRSAVASVAASESTRPATRLHPPFAPQHTHRGELCPLGSGVIRFQCLRHPETARRIQRSRPPLASIRRWGRARRQARRTSRGIPGREARSMRLSALHARRTPFHAVSRHAASRGRTGFQPKLNSRGLIWYLKEGRGQDQRSPDNSSSPVRACPT